MLCSCRSFGLEGIAGYEVAVESDLSPGLPAFDVVGLPDAAVKEARERIRSGSPSTWPRRGPGNRAPCTTCLCSSASSRP